MAQRVVPHKLTRRNSEEQNRKVMESALWTNEEVKELRESIKNQFGIDLLTDSKDDGKFPVLKEGFSFGAVREKMMKESISSGSFTQLLRAGIQTVFNNMYQSLSETTYNKWAHVIQSDKDEELYAPIHGIGFPREVPRKGKFPSASMAGLDMKLKNRQFGEIFEVEAQLLENDQTGQVKNQVSLMVEYSQLVFEIYANGKLSSVSGQKFDNLKVPTSETKPSGESSYPWSTALIGGGKTKNAAAAFNVANFQIARRTLRAQKNLLGLKMTVKSTALLHSPYYELDVATILNSAFYPAGAAAAGSTGGAFSQNFLKGIATPIMIDYMFDNAGVIDGLSKAWYTTDNTRPAFVVQVRQPGRVIQENPESGESFERKVTRWRLDMEGNADFIDPRFFFQGSDGSV